MTQITINNINETQKQILASSSNNFQVELIINIGKEDYPSLIEISKYLVKKFGNQALLTEQNIPKYFNRKTLPFIARYNKNIIGYIIGVPLEYFKDEAWSHFDSNLSKENTLYTYAFVLEKKLQ